MEDIVSVGWTAIVYDAGGFRDLNRIEIDAAGAKCHVSIKNLAYPRVHVCSVLT